MVYYNKFGRGPGSSPGPSLSDLVNAIRSNKPPTAFHFCSDSKFSINILAHDQRAVCDAMAVSGGDKFASFDWAEGNHGVPVLDGVIGYVECDLTAEHDAGDHIIAIGAVKTFEVVAPDKTPLLFFRGAYGDFSADA